MQSNKEKQLGKRSGGAKGAGDIFHSIAVS
jgi:hypothetical protein